MSVSLAWELSFLFRSLCNGFMIGGFFCLLACLRLWYRLPDWIVSLQDLFGVILCTLQVYLLFFRWSNGDLRGCSLVFMCLGIWLYCNLPGKWVLHLMRNLCQKRKEKRKEWKKRLEEKRKRDCKRKKTQV